MIKFLQKVFLLDYAEWISRGYILTLLGGIIIVYAILKSLELIKGSTTKVKSVHPMVSGRIPIIGHALQLENQEKFFNKCIQKYGPIFQIQIFRLNYTIIADRSVFEAIARTSEDEASVTEALLESYTLQSLYGPSTHPLNFLKKKGIPFKVSEILPVLEDEALLLVKRLRERFRKYEDYVHLDFENQLLEFKKYVLCSTSQFFLGTKPDEEIFNLYHNFSKLVSKAGLSSVFFSPKFQQILREKEFLRMRTEIGKSFSSTIQKYRDNRELKDSSILRDLVDAVHPDTGKRLTDTEIQNELLGFYIAASHNNTSWIRTVLIDLIQHPSVLQELRNEIQDLMTNGQLEEVVNSQLLKAVMMETLRLSTVYLHMSRIMRVDKVIGGQLFKKGENLIVASGILMTDPKVFRNPEVWDPHRYLDGEKESWDSSNILTWAAGTHLCPGKQLSILLSKLGVAFLVYYFEMEITGNISISNTPQSAIAEKICTLTFKDRVDAVVAMNKF